MVTCRFVLSRTQFDYYIYCSRILYKFISLQSAEKYEGKKRYSTQHHTINIKQTCYLILAINFGITKYLIVALLSQGEIRGLIVIGR